MFTLHALKLCPAVTCWLWDLSYHGWLCLVMPATKATLFFPSNETKFVLSSLLGLCSLPAYADQVSVSCRKDPSVFCA